MLNFFILYYNYISYIYLRIYKISGILRNIFVLDKTQVSWKKLMLKDSNKTGYNKNYKKTIKWLQLEKQWLIACSDCSQISPELLIPHFYEPTLNHFLSISDWKSCISSTDFFPFLDKGYSFLKRMHYISGNMNNTPSHLWIFQTPNVSFLHSFDSPRPLDLAVFWGMSD